MRPNVLALSARSMPGTRPLQRSEASPSPCLPGPSQLPVMLALILFLAACCPNFAAGVSDRFCDPLLMAFVSIDQRSSHCLDSAWRLPPSSLVTLHFTVSHCSPSPRYPPASGATKVGGYAIVTEGVFLLKRYRHFDAHDFGVALNDSFVLPREFAARTQPIPLEFLLIDDEDGVSSRWVRAQCAAVDSLSIFAITHVSAASIPPTSACSPPPRLSKASHPRRRFAKPQRLLPTTPPPPIPPPPLQRGALAAPLHLHCRSPAGACHAALAPVPPRSRRRFHAAVHNRQGLRRTHKQFHLCLSAELHAVLTGSEFAAS